MKNLFIFILLISSIVLGQAFTTSKLTQETLWQDPTNALFAQPFMRAESVPTSLSADITINTYTMTVTSVTNITVGDIIVVASVEGRFYRGVVLSIATNTLTMDAPIDYGFLSGDVVLDMTKDLNVDGSGTPVSFYTESGSALTLDITRLILVMTTTTQPDLSTFGDITALTRGCVMRLAYADGSYKNLGTAKTNADMANLAYDITIHDNTKFGEYGLALRWTFSDPSKMGAVIRLYPGDRFEYIILDDLTGILNFSIIAEGHEAEE